MALIYVDQSRITSIATPIIGSTLNRSTQITTTGGFNWIIGGAVSHTENKTVTTQVRDMLPEIVATELYKSFEEDIELEKLIFKDVDSCTKALREWESEENAGKTIRVAGIMHIKDFDGSCQEYDPFDPPEKKPLHEIEYYGRKCIITELSSDGISLPVYFPSDSISIIAYCNGKNVDIIGTLGFCGWYNVGRNRSINMIVNGAAVWVK